MDQRILHDGSPPDASCTAQHPSMAQHSSGAHAPGANTSDARPQQCHCPASICSDTASTARSSDTSSRYVNYMPVLPGSRRWLPAAGVAAEPPVIAIASHASVAKPPDPYAALAPLMSVQSASKEACLAAESMQMGTPAPIYGLSAPSHHAPGDHSRIGFNARPPSSIGSAPNQSMPVQASSQQAAVTYEDADEFGCSAGNGCCEGWACWWAGGCCNANCC